MKNKGLTIIATKNDYTLLVLFLWKKVILKEASHDFFCNYHLHFDNF